MTVGFTLIDSKGDNATATSITSNAFNPVAGATYLVFGGCRTGALGTVAITSTETDCEITVGSPTSQQGTTTACVYGMIKIGASPGTGKTVTVDFGVSTIRHTIQIVRVTGAHSAFTIGLTGSHAQGTGSTCTTSFTSGSSDASSGVIGCCVSQGASNITADTGTELDEVQGGTSTVIRSNVQIASGALSSLVWGGMGSNTASIILEVRIADTVTDMVSRVISEPKGQTGAASNIVSKLVFPTTIGGIICVWGGCRFGTVATAITPTITDTLDVGSWSTAIMATNSNFVHQLFMWAPITGLTPGTITLDFSSSPDQGRLIIITEITGQADTPIKQSKAGSSTTPGTTFTVTMDAAPDADSEVLGCITNYEGAGVDIVPANTELAEVQGSVSTILGMELQRMTTPGQSVVWNTINNSRTAALAIEIDKYAAPATQPSGQKVVWF